MNSLKLTLEETLERIHKMAENNIKERENNGIRGENPDFITLWNAEILLSKYKETINCIQVNKELLTV